MRLLLRFIALLVLFTPGVNAQWRLTHTFDSPVRVICFLNDVGLPETGFAGLQDGEVWKTIDGGATWAQCQMPSGLNSIASFAFKDKLKGWLGIYEFGYGTYDLLSTSDGGQTWNQMGLSDWVTCLWYDHATGILFGTLGEPIGAAYSTDDGQSWNTISDDAYTSVSFANSQSGIIVNFAGAQQQLYLVTHDGGKTWGSISMTNENWQPAFFPNGNTYCIISEYTSELLRSDNGGDTWNVVSKFPWSSLHGSNGCSCVDACGKLYYQTVWEGFWMSADTGKSWSAISGPNDYMDSRFIIHDGTIIAGDSTGDLYVYPIQGSAFTGLAFVSNVAHIAEKNCEPVDTSISYWAEACGASTFTLDSLWLTGSSEFQILNHETLPRQDSTMDSVMLEYAPKGSNANDTCVLHLQYRLGATVSDTTVLLIGNSPSPLFAHPQQLHRESSSAYFGQMDTLSLGVDISSNVAIDSIWPSISNIQATFSWDSSVVLFTEYLPPNGWILTSLTNRGDSVDFEIQNNASTPVQPMMLGTALFSPRTTTLASTWIELPRFVMDIGNQAVSLCVTDNEDNHWAVKTLGVHNGVREVPPPLKEIAVYPNPATDKLCFQNSNDVPISVAIYDAIGRTVATSDLPAASTVWLDITLIPSGPYIIVMRNDAIVMVRQWSKLQ